MGCKRGSEAADTAVDIAVHTEVDTAENLGVETGVDTGDTRETEGIDKGIPAPLRFQG